MNTVKSINHFAPGTDMEIIPNQPEIVRLEDCLQAQASQVLGRAFFNDPMHVYYLPDEDMRRQVLPVIERILLRYCLTYGEVWTTPGLQGVALWLPPDHTRGSNWGMLRAILWSVSLRGWWKFLRLYIADDSSEFPLRQILRQVMQGKGHMDEIHQQIVPGRHWYLMVLGVDPVYQGRGIGSQLIAPTLERARLAGLPCYLETGTELDVAFYRKNGFKVAYHEVYQPGNLNMWGMVRLPEDLKR